MNHNRLALLLGVFFTILSILAFYTGIQMEGYCSSVAWSIEAGCIHSGFVFEISAVLGIAALISGLIWARR